MFADLGGSSPHDLLDQVFAAGEVVINRGRLKFGLGGDVGKAQASVALGAENVCRRIQNSAASEGGLRIRFALAKG